MLVQDIYQQQEVQDMSKGNSEEQEMTSQPIAESAIWGHGSMVHGKIFPHGTSHTGTLNCCILRFVFSKCSLKGKQPLLQRFTSFCKTYFMSERQIRQIKKACLNLGCIPKKTILWSSEEMFFHLWRIKYVQLLEVTELYNMNCINVRSLGLFWLSNLLLKEATTIPMGCSLLSTVTWCMHFHLYIHSALPV